MEEMDAGLPIRQSRRMGNGRVIAWGGYDKSKPRVRLLLDALRKRDALAGEINIDVWRGIEDKSVAGKARILKAVVKLLLAYPSALLKLLRQPSRPAVLLPYPGIADILVAAVVAKPRGQMMILDAFVPLHDTVVGDRAMVARRSAAARLLRAIEGLALRCADIVLVDTDQHGEFYANEYGIARDRFVTVLVGAEPLFGAQPEPVELPGLTADVPVVLFYGQLIPLHGVRTILDAARLTRGDRVHWLIVGRGQDEATLRAAMAEPDRANITWLPWVDYDQLPGVIARAQICLGIFGKSDKAARVIPNKVFQALACGKPVITRASPAMDPLAARFPHAIVTVPAGDPIALATAVRRVIEDIGAMTALPAADRARLGPDEGVADLLDRLERGRQP
jgi:glycosyltransferase involved in cell wall biosynthesis